MEADLSRARREPIFNLPAVVTAVVAVLLGIHAVREFLLPPELDLQVLVEGAFIPARLALLWDPAPIMPRDPLAELPREAALQQLFAHHVVAEGASKPWTALTYALLHGSWGHVLLNGVWLAAFGTPVARRCGALRFLLLGALAAAGGALAHAAVHPSSVLPMIGASAAVSGWMAAAARFVFAPERHGASFRGPAEAHEGRRQPLAALLRNRSAAMFLAVWFATNLLFGLAAEPLGVTQSAIAWEAHLGGFLIGLLLFPWLDRRPA